MRLVQVARKPAERARAGRRLDARHRLAHEVTLAILVVGELVHPAPAVAACLMPALGDGARDLRRAFQGDGGGGEGDGDAVLLEHRPHPRPAGADAVGVVGFVAEVADRNLERDAELVHRLRPLVAVAQRHLRTFLDVDHDAERQPRAIRPHQCFSSSAPKPRILSMMPFCRSAHQ
jgi:hypothetical protein